MKEITKAKQHVKGGAKYMLIGAIGIFGPSIYYADRIDGFKAGDLADVPTGKAALFRSTNGKVARINVNGTLR